MQILLVAHYAPPHHGGIEFVVGALCQHYTAAGHTVTIVASDAEIPKSPTLPIKPIPALNTLERFAIPYPLFNPFALFHTLDRLLDRVDAVHVHGMIYMSSVLASWLGARRGLPVVLTEHVGRVTYSSRLVNLVQEMAVQTLGRIACRSSSSVVVLNGRVKAEIKGLMKPGASPLKIPNGVDTALFSPPLDRTSLRADWGFSKPTLLFVGRLVGKKGGDLVVEAARQTPDIDYVFCGKDTERVSGLLPNLRSVGAVDQAALAGLYGAADALLLPSESEGFPLVVQEAMACGLPVMVTDNPTNREYLDETVAVFVQRDPASIAARVMALVCDDARRTVMGAAARQWAEQHFDWEKTAAAYLALLDGAR